MPAIPLPPGTIVLRQNRGLRKGLVHGRILDSSITLDALGRRQLWYRVQVISSTDIKRWLASHCTVVAPAPA